LRNGKVIINYCWAGLGYRQIIRKWMGNDMTILTQVSVMRWFLALTVGLFVTLIYPTLAQSDTKIPNEINVTRDSPPGWYPSPDLEQRAQTAAEKYLAKFDVGEFEDAYTMMAELFKVNASEAQFTQFGRHIVNSTGTILSRKFLKTTWTKDPAKGPLKGIFAAIDIASKYTNADRSCGYLIMYQAPGADVFKVMRIENNFMTNVTAEAITKSKSKKTLDELWSTSSANCPNYSRD
jgi:Protein of unknown function (DUF4019)